MPDKAKIKPLKKGKPPKKGEKDTNVIEKHSGRLKEWFPPERLRWFILVGLCLIISLFLFPNILTRPQTYRIGDVAEKDIKASRDFLIENRELTEESREKAVKEVLSIYDFDSSSSNLVPRLKEAFNDGREHYDKRLYTGYPEMMNPSDVEKTSQEVLEEDNLLKNRFFETLDIQPDEKLFELLIKTGFPPEVEAAVIEMVSGVLKKGVVGNRAMLMRQVKKGGIILHEIYTQRETIITDLDSFYDLEGARRFVKKQGRSLRKSISTPRLDDLSIRLAQILIKPNLTFNKRETELRKDLARKSIKPIYFKIKKGEMLIREGERIGPEHIIKLSRETESENRIDMLGRMPAMALLIGLLFSVMYIIGIKGVKPSDVRRRDLLFQAITLFGIFLFAWAYSFVAEEVARGFHFFTSRALLFAMPIACGAMIISIFQGLALAVSFSLAISVLASLITGGQVEFFVYFFISSLIAAHGVTDCRERGVLIKAGLKVGLINILLSLSIEIIIGSLYSLESLIAAAAGFVGGVLTGVIATGILPLIEMTFGFTTDIKLMELASLDQPLLRQLMVQAPGTYHHSVIISNMVEATAEAVNANPLLAKVSAYYHDIGKMKKPLYFIENQMGGENRHEKLAPSMSSLILISHAKDGVELARKHKLGKEIIDIIQQHHGTTLISFFYIKAKERAVVKSGKSKEVEEENFRYPGPKPQTKEAGLVMLADMVEAASRSLKDPTPARIQGMVQRIINNVFSDGQLDDCELTLKDLNKIAKSFNKILSGIFHQRIEYPEMVARNGKKGKNGSADQIPEEDTGSKKTEDATEVDECLKRLGLS